MYNTLSRMIHRVYYIIHELITVYFHDCVAQRPRREVCCYATEAAQRVAFPSALRSQLSVTPRRACLLR